MHQSATWNQIYLANCLLHIIRNLKWKDSAFFSIKRRRKMTTDDKIINLFINVQENQHQSIVFVQNLLRDVQLLHIKNSLTKNRLMKNETFSLMAPIGRLVMFAQHEMVNEPRFRDPNSPQWWNWRLSKFYWCLNALYLRHHQLNIRMLPS